MKPVIKHELRSIQTHSAPYSPYAS
jgi:hypothetical protein